MSLTSPIQEWYIKKFQGMNNKMEDNELSVEHSILTQNARFENEPGALIKRDPISYYNPTTMSATNRVPSLVRWRGSDGEAVMNAICGSKMYVGNDNTGVMTEVRGSLTENKKTSFVVYKNLLIGSNGYDNPFCYDGGSENVTWELGSCKAVLAPGGSNLDSGAAYYYAVVIEYQAGVFYICGAVSNTVTTTASYRKVTLSEIPVGPIGTVSRMIYRTEGGGSSLKLLTTISDNTTTTYTDDIADGSLSTAMGAVTDDMPKGNLLTLHRERLFISGDPAEPNRIYYSDAYLPWFIQQTTLLTYMDVFPDEGDEIQGIPVIQDVMVCFKRNTIRKIFVQQATSGASPESWYASDIISYHGCPAKWSIAQSIYGIMYLGWDHWYLFDGNQSREIIDEFDTDDILGSDFRNVTSIFFDGILYATYTDATTASQVKDRLMVYNFRRKALDVDDVRVDSFAAYVGGDDSSEFFYGSSEQGFIYYAERAEKVIKWRRKSEIDDATFTDASVQGEENDPYIVISRTLTIDELDYDGTGGSPTGAHPDEFDGSPAGSAIDDLVGTIDMRDTTGTVVFPAMQLSVGTFGKLFWNLRRFHDSDTTTFYVRTGATQAACEAAAWGTGYTDSSGSTITTAVGEWVQIKVDLVANSLAGSPMIYKSDGFVIKMTYNKGGSLAETAVEFIHEVGYRNFDAPNVDKIFKKITANWEGLAGEVTVTWATEFATGTFTIDLTNYPQRWESFFPANAFGRKLNLTIYKNDLEDLKLKEFKGIFTPEPIII